METNRSVLQLMLRAYDLGQRLWPDYRSEFSRQDFTQPQLFACLVVRESLEITQQPSADSSTITGTTADLSMLADENGSGNGLTYQWSTLGQSPAAVTFSDNGDNTAKNTTATFTAPGTYTFDAIVSDGSGHSLSSQDVTVSVEPTPTAVTLTPATVDLPLSTAAQPSTQQFTATVTDQFGIVTPFPLSWSCSGDGSIDPQSGLYTAPTSGSGARINVNYGRYDNATATITLVGGSAGPPIVERAAGTVDPSTGYTTANLSVLASDPSGAASLTYTWSTVGTPPAAVTFSDNGDNSAKDTTATFTAAGSYTFQATVEDAAGLTATSDVTLTVQQAATSAPGAPTNVVLSTLPIDGLMVSWDSGSADATSYLVQRSDDMGNTWQDVGTVASGTTELPDFDATAGNSHTYRVFAANSRGSSAASQPSAPGSFVVAPTNVTATDVTGDAILTRSIQLTWNGSSPGGYTIQMLQDDGVTWSNIGSVASGQPDTYLFSETLLFTSTRIFSFKVVAVGASAPNSFVSTAESIPARVLSLGAVNNPTEYQLAFNLLSQAEAMHSSHLYYKWAGVEAFFDREFTSLSGVYVDVNDDAISNGASAQFSPASNTLFLLSDASISDVEHELVHATDWAQDWYIWESDYQDAEALAYGSERLVDSLAGNNSLAKLEQAPWAKRRFFGSWLGRTSSREL